MLPKTCSECAHMGNFGHGEPPPCNHPLQGDVGRWQFANPRSAPPDWCPLPRIKSREETINAIWENAGHGTRLKDIAHAYDAGFVAGKLDWKRANVS